MKKSKEKQEKSTMEENKESPDNTTTTTATTTTTTATTTTTTTTATTTNKPAMFPQALGTLLTSLAQMDAGAVFSYPAVALPQLLDKTSHDLVFDTAQAALFGSVIYLGAMVGSLLGGLPMVKVGQRVTLLIALPLSFAAWIALFLAPSFWLILAARIVQGIALSPISSASNVYVTEIAHSSVRGRLLASTDICRHIGFLSVYCLGLSSLSWRQVALTVACMNILIPFVGLIFLPNSPRWLVTRERTEEARKALKFYRGSNYDSEMELQDIVTQFHESSASKMSVVQQLKHIREPSILRYFIIMSVFLFILHFNGLTIMPAYVIIVMNSTEVQMSSYVAAIVVGVTKITGTICFGLIVDRFNRKTLFTIASTLSALSTAVMGGYFYDQVHEGRMQHLQWLPLLCLVVQAVASATPIINLFRSELFPTSVRATVVPMLYLTFFIGAFVALQTYPYIVEGLGDHNAFWMFSACNVVLLLIVVCTLPETRGKTLEEITEIQRRKARGLSNATKLVSYSPVPDKDRDLEQGLDKVQDGETRSEIL